MMVRAVNSTALVGMLGVFMMVRAVNSTALEGC